MNNIILEVNKIKTRIYFKGILRFYIALIIFLFITTILNYLNVISYKTLSLLSFIFMISLFLYTGFYIAKNNDKRGYINGLIIGVLNIILILLLSLLLGGNPKISIGIYLLILLLSSTIGGMFGINFKNKNSQ